VFVVDAKLVCSLYVQTADVVNGTGEMFTRTVLKGTDGGVSWLVFVGL
jgi:hypothetical protein